MDIRAISSFSLHNPVTGLCCFCEHVAGFHWSKVLDQRVWIFKNLIHSSSCSPQTEPVYAPTICMNTVSWGQLWGRDQWPSTFDFCQSQEGNSLFVVGTADLFSYFQRGVSWSTFLPFYMVHFSLFSWDAVMLGKASHLPCSLQVLCVVFFKTRRHANGHTVHHIRST